MSEDLTRKTNKLGKKSRYEKQEVLKNPSNQKIVTQLICAKQTKY